MSEIQNPYDICIPNIMLWGLGPNEWLQKLHSYTNQIVTSIFRRVFSFSSFHLGHVPDCVAPRETSIALLPSRNRHAYACHFFGGADFKLRFKILTPTKTTRKAVAMRFVAPPCVLDCIRGSYAGLFRGLNFNHVILSLKSKSGSHWTNFTNVPHAVH